MAFFATAALSGRFSTGASKFILTLALHFLQVVYVLTREYTLAITAIAALQFARLGGVFEVVGGFNVLKSIDFFWFALSVGVLVQRVSVFFDSFVLTCLAIFMYRVFPLGLHCNRNLLKVFVVATFVFQVSLYLLDVDRFSDVRKLVRLNKRNKSDWFKTQSAGFGFNADNRFDPGQDDNRDVRIAKVMVSDHLRLDGLSDNDIRIVFSRSRSDEEDILYRSWKVLGDEIFSMAVLHGCVGFTAGEISKVKTSLCSAKVFGLAVRKRFSARGISCGNYGDHTLMDKFEALLWLKYLACGSYDKLIDELLEFIREGYHSV